MIFLDPDAVFRRTIVAVVAVILTTGAGYTVWYNLNLKSVFDEGVQETNNLREETSRLGAETDGLRNNFNTATEEIRYRVISSAEEIRRLDAELKQHQQALKALNADIEKHRVDAKIEMASIREINVDLQRQVKSGETSLEKQKVEFKTEVQSLKEQLKAKEKEISDLKSKLEKEIEWRTKNFWSR